MASAKTSRFCLYKCRSCCPLPWLVEGSLKAPKWLLLTIYNSCCWCNIGNHSNFLFLANWSYAFLTAQVRKANLVVLPSCLWRPHIRHVSANVVKNAEPMIVIGHLKQQTPPRTTSWLRTSNLVMRTNNTLLLPRDSRHEMLQFHQHFLTSNLLIPIKSIGCKIVWNLSLEKIYPSQVPKPTQHYFLAFLSVPLHCPLAWSNSLNSWN